MRTDVFRLSVLSLAACPLLLTTACGPKDCGPGFDEGERFQITVKGKSREEDSCDLEHPEFEPGDTFTLVGGTLFPIGHSTCLDERGARPLSPAPWSEVGIQCVSNSHQLGIACDWDRPCGGSFEMSLGPRISRDDQTIEDGVFTITWQQLDCDGASLGICIERYDVRIERLD